MIDHAKFSMRFDGADADRHALGMRQLGESLIGAERLITIGLFALETGQLPRRNQSLPMSIKVSEPMRGSFDVGGFIENLKPFLPFIHDLHMSKASEIVWRWMSGALLRMGGREQDSREHLEAVIGLMDRTDARRHLEALNWQKLAFHASRLVSPVGPSCDRLLLPMNHEETEIDLPIAEAVRSRNKLEVGDMQTFDVMIDGSSVPLIVE